MKQTLILKTGSTIPVIAEEKGDFEQWIATGMSLSVNQTLSVSVFEGQALPDLQSISSIVITGSPAMATEKLDWIEKSQHFILSAINAGIPVLGICFGHQLLAQAMGGKVDWHPQGREIGTTLVNRSTESFDDPLFNEMPVTFPVHTTHMQTVTELPSDAIILASNEFESHHAVRFARNVWGVQFHPEFDAAIMRRYIKERHVQIDDEGLNSTALLADVCPTPEALLVLRNFSALAS
ncbi:glutamine amidotransferase [Gammaproteobacteria bacterium]|nr:glutamine amidotransferase [Gammaproteobacteria bacterium]